jgi:nucleoid-associated protein YgaU
MTSTEALRVSGTTAVGGGGVPRGAESPRRPERHLRVLPPPAAYVGAPERQNVRAAGVMRPAGSARPSPLRLTARGRRLVAVLVLALGVAMVTLGDAVLGGDEDGLELMGTTSVVVERGDTLWSIARSVAGDRDVREVIDGIQGLNRLDGAEITPGQILRLPRGNAAGA